MKPAFVDRVALVWVRAYTRGTPESPRDARRAELRSDLWEHRAAAHGAGVGAGATSLSIAARAVAGVPSDLAWRRDVKGAAMTTTMIDGRRGTGMVADVLAALMGGFAALAGLAAMIDHGQGGGWPVHIFVTGAALLAGAYLRTRRPPVGLALVVAGAISWSVATYWMRVTVIAGAVLIVLAVIATTRPRRREAA